MSARSPWGQRLVMSLVLLAGLLAPSDLSGRPSEAAPATPPAQPTILPGPLHTATPAPQPQATIQGGPARTVAPAMAQPQATVQGGAGRAGRSPTLLGDINNDGIVDVRDYGVWRQAFGATDCVTTADLDSNCIVDIRDYGIWRQNFGQTGPTSTPTSNAATTVTPRG